MVFRNLVELIEPSQSNVEIANKRGARAAVPGDNRSGPLFRSQSAETQPFSIVSIAGWRSVPDFAAPFFPESRKLRQYARRSANVAGGAP